MGTEEQGYNWSEVYRIMRQHSIRAMLLVEHCSELAFEYFDIALDLLRRRAEGSVTDEQDDEISDRLGAIWLKLQQSDQATITKLFTLPAGIFDKTR